MPRDGAVGFVNTVQDRTDYTPCDDSATSHMATTSFYRRPTPATRLYKSDRLRFPLRTGQEGKPLTLIVRGGTTVRDNHLKQLISLVKLARSYPMADCPVVKLVRSYSVADYAMSILVSKPSVFQPVVVRLPKRRVLASMRVRLSSKDFKRRLPRPVISLGPEVEP